MNFQNSIQDQVFAAGYRQQKGPWKYACGIQINKKEIIGYSRYYFNR